MTRKRWLGHARPPPCCRVTYHPDDAVEPGTSGSMLVPSPVNTLDEAIAPSPVRSACYG